MHRIDTPTAQKDKFGAGKNGFTRGNPQTGTPATDLDDDYFDTLQEELAGVVEAAGIALDKTKRNQLLEALFRLGAGAPAIGVPFFWPSAAMPNTVLPEWSGMVFLKFNGATFSAATYPKLALVFPALLLPEARGEFLRVWDDGRGVDAGRALLSAQLDALQNITGAISVGDNNSVVGAIGAPTGAFTGVNDTGKVPVWASGSVAGTRYAAANFNAGNVARTATETRSRNIAFNLLVRAK
ncbi:hypothetical protein D3C78_548310 [compost metagenome]